MDDENNTLNVPSVNGHPNFNTLLKEALQAKPPNKERINALTRLSTRRKKSTFAVSPLHSPPVTPKAALVDSDNSMSSIDAQRIDSSSNNQPLPSSPHPPRASSPMPNSVQQFSRSCKPKGWNHSLADYSKRDEAWKQLMIIVGIVYELSDRELKRLISLSSFGNDLVTDMLIGVFAERDWEIFAQLFTLDIIDPVHMLLFVCDWLEDAEIQRIVQQLTYWKEKVVHETHYRSIKSDYDLFNNSQYEHVKAVSEVIESQDFMNSFDLIKSWVHENMFRIAQSKSSGRHDLWMSDLWYCPLWLHAIATNCRFQPRDKLLLAEYEFAVREWMNVVIDAKQLRNLRGVNRPTLKISDLIQYLKQDQITRALPQLGEHDLFEDISQMDNTKHWNLAHSIAEVLLVLRYEIIKNIAADNRGNETVDMPLLKNVYEIALNCFKSTFMSDNWMYAEPAAPKKTKNTDRFLSNWGA